MWNQRQRIIIEHGFARQINDRDQKQTIYNWILQFIRVSVCNDIYREWKHN